MGFIEEEERKFKEKQVEQSVRNMRIEKELADLNSNENKIEQKSASQLRDESKREYLASGLGTMLKRLSKADTIVRVDSVEKYRKIGAYSDIDGRYHAEVTVNDDIVTDHDKYVRTIKYFNLVTDSSGLITFEYGNFIKHIKAIEKSDWSGNSSLLEEQLEKACKSPFVRKHKGVSYGDPGPDMGFCLSGGTLISVPSGFIQVKNLKIGESIWSSNEIGQMVKTHIRQQRKKIISSNHKMAHITLEDGRKLIVSPGHPTIDNKELGLMKKGQILDGSRIASIEILPYEEKYTYDILPAGDTGAYWANGILIGSTLSPQFKKMQEKKFSKQISWYSRLFA